jgi:large subunit ribosomal protein L23
MAEKGLKKFFTGLKKSEKEKKSSLKKGQEKKEKKEKSVPAEVKTPVAKSVLTVKKPEKKASKKVLPVDPHVLIHPVITEKATDLQSQGCYVFEVGLSVNKVMVKRAVESLYGVVPRRVNMGKIRGKAVRYGRSHGRTKDRKKAIVFLNQGDKIDFASK